MERTELRKELIEFYNWIISDSQNDIFEEFPDGSTAVAAYIKSINSAPSESQSVVDNKDEEKPSVKVVLSSGMCQYAVRGGYMYKIGRDEGDSSGR